jgi:hypothetical protein
MTRQLITAAAIAATVAMLGGVSETAASAAPTPVSHYAFSRGGAILSGPKVAPHIVAQSLRSRIHTDGGSGSLPTSVDLSQYDMPVGDQGSVDDSCVPWAIDYAMFGWYANEVGESTAFAPMYSYSQLHADNSAGGGGTSGQSVLLEAESQGVDTQSDYTQGNYNFTTAPTSSEIANAAHYKAVGYTNMYNNNVGPGTAAVNPIETELASGNPIALTIANSNAFGMLTSTNYNLDASQVSWGTYTGLHEVLAVGYDSTGVTIQNSWGTSWGHNGYAHLNWDFIETYSLTADTITGLTITGAPAPVTPPVVTPPAPPAPAPGPVAPPAPITPPAPVTPPVVKPVPAPVKKTLATAPRSLKVTVNAKNLNAVATWAAPASAGSVAITEYKVTGPAAVTVKGTSITFTHLVAGRSYTVTVAAITSVGTGAATSITMKG